MLKTTTGDGETLTPREALYVPFLSAIYPLLAALPPGLYVQGHEQDVDVPLLAEARAWQARFLPTAAPSFAAGPLVAGGASWQSPQYAAPQDPGQPLQVPLVHGIKPLVAT